MQTAAVQEGAELGCSMRETVHSGHKEQRQRSDLRCALVAVALAAASHACSRSRVGEARASGQIVA